MAEEEKKLVPDPDEEDQFERGRRNLMLRNAAAASRPVPPAPAGAAAIMPEAPNLVPSPPAEAALATPMTQPTKPPTYLERLQDQFERTYAKQFPERQPGYQKPTGWRRFGHIMGRVGEDIGLATVPNIIANIPGTRTYRERQLEALGKDISEEQERESLGEYRKAELPKIQAETERDLAEAAKARAEMTGPALATGEFATATNPQTGEQLAGYTYGPKAGGGMAFVPPGTIPPTAETPQAPAQNIPGAIAGIPTAPAQPPRPGGLPPGFVLGPPKEADVKNQFFAAADAVSKGTATQAQQNLYGQHVGEWGKQVPATQADLDAANRTMNDRYEANRRIVGPSMPHPPGIKLGESAEDIEKKQAAYEKLIADEVDRKQRELEALPGKELAQQLQQERLLKLQQDRDNEAFVGYGNLYAQENYRNAMAAWQKSANYTRDLGFVNAIVNEAKTQLPGAPGLSTTAGALVGAAVGGPPGAAIGAAAAGLGSAATSILGGIISPIANGYLDAARKRGISQEGYNAMQAYFNALPGRMSYELTTQGIKASTMRSAILLQKVMQTVPSPDTPRDVFGKAFDNYYNPMKALTDHKYKREGYTPPSYKDIYGEEATPAAPAAPAAPKPGQHWNPKTGKYE